MSQYDISVIIPVYNTEKYLDESIGSILNQTKKNIEIVLVDDGSTDGSPEIVDRYAAQYENIVAVHQPNGGPGLARANGLRHASGKYIGWVDSDDFLGLTALEEMYNLLIENDADYTYCDIAFYPHDLPLKAKWFKQYYGVVDWNYIERNSQCTNSLTSKALLDEINIADLFIEFNEYAWIAVLLNSKKTVVMNKVFYHYRVGMNSRSGGTYKGKVPRFIEQVELTKKLPKLLIGTGYEESLKEYFEYRVIYTLLMLAIVAAINSDKENYRSACRELKEKKFKKHPLVKVILDNNFGKLKSFVVRNLVPMNYLFAKAITTYVYGK